ncbi:Profilin [Escovopsis weberi]|uniref:Profilin n=1 Tax=Escovopsis weberi TaxID=150374 RepID=A0A0M8N0T9_ESCWE|nr:Profilin [Escovopsis weberi]
MSWQQYVDSSLVASGHVDKAALVSGAGDSIWAQSTGFQPLLPELKIIADILNNNQAAKDKAFADGLNVAGVRYVMARADDRSIYARQKKDGICITKSKQAIIIAHHNEQQVAGNASSTVESLADYLIKMNY